MKFHVVCAVWTQAVEEEGGYDAVCGERKWSKIAERLGYGLNSKGIGGALQQHYKRVLYPFDVFNQSKSTDAKLVRDTTIVGLSLFLETGIN